MSEFADERAPRRRPRSSRLLEGELLRALLLQLIAEQPRHGYELIREIEHRASQAYVPSPGVVYPALARLQAEGLIAAQERTDLRKAYELTPEGAATLPRMRDAVGRAYQQLDQLRAAAAAAQPAPVARALENLGAAVRHRMGEVEASRTLALQVADLLDEAARKIERL